MDKTRIVGEEGFHTVRDSKMNLLAILGRDPVSGEHLVYFVTKGNSADIAEKLIKNDSRLDKKDGE